MVDVITIIAAIGSAIVSVIGVWRSVTNREKKRIHKYYKKVVLPFIDEYSKGDNEGRNWCKFLSCQIKCTDESIPPYIQYLVGKRNNEKLQAVLLNDAFEYYNNKQFWFSCYFNATINIVIYIVLISIIIGIAFSIMVVTIMFLSFISNYLVHIMHKVPMDLEFSHVVSLCFLYVLVCCGLCGLYKLFGQLLIDDYTHDLSKMQKIINRKTKKVKKKIQDVFFENIQ